MKNSNRLAIIILIGISFFLYGFCLNTTSDNDPNDISPTPIPGSAVSSELIESNISNTYSLLEYYNRINERILNTVYWTLGTFATLTLAFLGINWFSNKKQFDLEKENIEINLKSNITEFKTELKKYIEDETSNVSSDLIKRTTEKTSELEGAFENSAKRNISYIDEKFISIKNEINDINLKILDEEALKWKTKQVYSNELRVYVEMFDYLKPNHWKTEKILNNIIDNLNNFSREDSSDLSLIKDLIHQIENLPEDFKDMKDNILTKARSKLD